MINSDEQWLNLMGSDSSGKPSAINLQFWTTTYDLFLDLFLAKLGWFLIWDWVYHINKRATVGPCFLWPSGQGADSAGPQMPPASTFQLLRSQDVTKELLNIDEGATWLENQGEYRPPHMFVPDLGTPLHTMVISSPGVLLWGIPIEQ